LPTAPRARRILNAVITVLGIILGVWLIYTWLLSSHVSKTLDRCEDPNIWVTPLDLWDVYQLFYRRKKFRSAWMLFSPLLLGELVFLLIFRTWYWYGFFVASYCVLGILCDHNPKKGYRRLWMAELLINGASWFFLLILAVILAHMLLPSANWIGFFSWAFLSVGCYAALLTRLLKRLDEDLARSFHARFRRARGLD
jgi:hypothetical protein